MSDSPPVILITGTRKGIGRYLADHYLSLGWQVCGCARGDADLDHPRYRHFQLDVGDERAVVSMVRACVRDCGRIDALLNNAGIASMNAALLTPGSTFERIFRTNCFGAFFFAREVAKHMVLRRRGRIVFFSTVARPLQLEGESAYAASKAAVESLTRIMARELGRDGITVNAVGPTPVETDLIRGVPAEAMQRLLARHAIPRMGTLEDVANVVEFFLRPESSFITGQVIYLGGAGD